MFVVTRLICAWVKTNAQTKYQLISLQVNHHFEHTGSFLGSFQGIIMYYACCYTCMLLVSTNSTTSDVAPSPGPPQLIDLCLVVFDLT